MQSTVPIPPLQRGTFSYIQTPALRGLGQHRLLLGLVLVHLPGQHLVQSAAQQEPRTVHRQRMNLAVLLHIHKLLLDFTLERENIIDSGPSKE